MSPPAFEQRLRQDLLLGAVQEPVASSNIVARQSVAQFVGLLEQQREIALALIDPQPFLKDVKIDDAQVREFYDKNPRRSRRQEQARIEYLLLTQEALIAQTVVDPADVRKTYDANVRQYTANEERGAAHILIAVKPDASDERKGRGEEAGRRGLRQGEGRAGQVRRPCPRVLAGPGFGRTGRRPRQLRARSRW